MTTPRLLLSHPHTPILSCGRSRRRIVKKFALPNNNNKQQETICRRVFLLSSSLIATPRHTNVTLAPVMLRFQNQKVKNHQFVVVCLLLTVCDGGG